MAGKKYGIVMAARVPGSYFTLSKEEQEQPGKVFEQLVGKYGNKVEFIRRYWTSAFTADCTDVFVMECDDLMDAHTMMQEMNTLMAQGGDPERFGETVSIWVGVNPDAG
ncbi:MAG TPA: hypothetical protein VG845_02175 [Dehalococcoidia bacterium]|jgi:hypothetical protein|nr:hypothetical protein [Dehalococcoidia bacterium]